jgi:excisionase family DNA binding protein
VINPRTDNDRPGRRRQLLDITGAATYITSSVRHVRRMVAERTIPHYKVGHFVRFDPDEIDDWLASHRRGPKDGPAAA